MKPNFALTLSFDGIGLLHRAAAGWHMVGEVPLSTDDLSGALAVLRRTAIQLDNAGLRSKLVIPNEQIRYLNLPAPARGTDIAAHVAAMLDGATPYVVSDLRYDWVVVGTDLHIAAVACETLDEAEAFAEEHGFAPVSFVAIPEAEGFPGEPFFGLTAAAAHLINPADRLMRDTHAIRVLGSVKAPASLDTTAVAAAAPLARPEAETPAAPETPATSDRAIKADDDSAAPTESAAKTAEPTADEATAAAADAAAQSMPVPVPGPVPGSGRPPLGILPVQSTAQAAEAEDDGAADDAGPEAAAIPPPAFASRRGAIPQNADAPETAADPEPSTSPALAAAQKGAKSGPAPNSTPDTTPDADAVTAGGIPAADAGAAPPAAQTAKPPAARGAQPSVGATPAPAASVPAANVDDPVLTPTAFRSAPPAPPAVSSGAAQKSASGLAALTARLKSQPATAGDAPAAEPDIAAVLPGVSRSEKERLTVFGARRPQGDSPADKRRSRLLVPALAASVVIVLAGIAAWSSISRDTTSRGFFDSADATDESELVVLPPEDTTALLTQEEDVLTPVPPPAVLDIARLDHSDMLGVIPEEDLTLSAPDADLAEDPQAAPELFEEPVALPDNAEPDAATALASYAATGIWLVAPAQPDTPPAETIDDLYIASIDTSLQNFDAVALPIARDTPVDTRPAAQSSPAAPGTSFDMDERGFVRATPEGAQTPDGALVFAGRPPVTPEGMPTRFDRTPQPDAEPAPSLSLTRPQLRPETLAESNERAQLGGMSLSELALLRPRARPETLAAVALALREEDAAEAELDEADATDALEGGTDQAIATSLKPLARPSNFASLVETTREAQQPPQQQQQQQQQPQQQQVAAATLAPQRNAAPQIPSSASVAQQATVRGAINLRQVNLIGVYGQPSNRRALVRLSNGRYQKVQVGDRLDGGQVRAIGESELSYVKGNRSIVLSLPRG